jgi:succinate dehydrogenase hydrophobic anchor subunit
MMLIFGWSATVGDWSEPMWLSWVALIVTTALAHFGFSLFRQSSPFSSFR